jgi:Uma2 family endonuclease
MASLPTTPLTEEQYLEIERRAATKSEFHDGQMFAMAGGSANHSLLANRIGALLYRQLPPECRTFDAGLRIKLLRPDSIPTRTAAWFAANYSFPATRRTSFSILC